MPHTPGGTHGCGMTVNPCLNFWCHTARSYQEPHTPGGTEVTSVDYGTLRRYHGLWVWLETGTRGLVRFRSGRFGNTVRWVCVVFAGWFGLGCRRSGRYGDTIRLGRSAWWPVGRNTLVWLLHCWDAPAIPCGGPGSSRVAKGWTLRRHQTVPLCLCTWQLAVGALRCYHPRTESKPWPQGNVRTCRHTAHAASPW